MIDPAELLPGTLDMLILKTVSLEPLHGWGISRRLGQISGDAIRLNQGSLYPALQRLKRRSLLKTEWRTTENNRRARYYELSDKGWAQLETERGNWKRATALIEQILGTA